MTLTSSSPLDKAQSSAGGEYPDDAYTILQRLYTWLRSLHRLQSVALNFIHEMSSGKAMACDGRVKLQHVIIFFKFNFANQITRK